MYQRSRYICLPTLEYYHKFYTDSKNKKLLLQSLPSKENIKNIQLQKVYGKNVQSQLCENKIIKFCYNLCFFIFFFFFFLIVMLQIVQTIYFFHINQYVSMYLCICVFIFVFVFVSSSFVC